MKQAKYVKFAFVLALCIFFGGMIIFESCHEKEDEVNSNTVIIPQNFPKSINFPVDSATILGWLNDYDTTNITKHAWDIWAGLTASSGEVLDGDSLLVFETWFGVKELAQFCADNNEQGGCAQEKHGRTALTIPRQFGHLQMLLGANANTSKGFSIYETVAYNPSAACFATSQLIFNEEVLEKYWVKDSIGAIPVFPKDAITTKPTYYAGKKDGSDLIKMPSWPGVPNPAVSYPATDWNTYVYVDVKNRQTSGKIAVPVTSDTPSKAQIEAATVNLNDFIHFKINKVMAAYLNEHQDNGNSQFVAGDYVLLVGMHVGTKEISNWTWQTFYWTVDPKNPIFPASQFTASLMPANLNGAASHYAVATAYAMVWPNQPVTNGTNTNVRAIIAFNPYLEAVLSGLGSRPGGTTNYLNASWNYGVQTNCMSCHAFAAQAFDTAALAQAPYSTDQYVDMKDTIFNNKVQLDLLWSIQGNVNPKKTKSKSSH